MKKCDQNCWDFWNNSGNKAKECKGDKQKNCPAYQVNSGKDCWFTSATYCLKYQALNGCWECAYYKKMNPSKE